MTDRTKKLKNNLFKDGKEQAIVDIDRLRLITEFYKKAEGEHAIKRRAKALQEILEGIPVNIRDGELIVGNMGRYGFSAQLFPEYSQGWVVEDLMQLKESPRQEFYIDDEDLAEAVSLLTFWKGECVEDVAKAQFTQEEKDAIEARVIDCPSLVDGFQGVILNHGELVIKGIIGRLKEIDQHLTEAKGNRDYKKIEFYEALKIVCNAFRTFVKKYAEEAERQAKEIADLARKKKLEEIARVCKRVSIQPASTFHEALQLVWFAQLVVQIESNGVGTSFGRFDQYMFPFYKKDLEEGRITREEALELLECFYIKLEELKKFKNYEWNIGLPTMFQTITLSGRTLDGRDGTNDVSYLCLDAARDMFLPQPPLQIRVNDDTPEDFLLKAAELLRAGLGQPAFQNDKRVISWMLKHGVPYEDAVNWAIQGCEDPRIAGKDSQLNTPIINLAKILEITLNNGVDPQTGKQLGPKSGDWRSFDSVNKILMCFERQFIHFTQLLFEAQGKLYKVHQELTPLPFLSMLQDDCIERGLELDEGGARYDWPIGPPKYSSLIVVALVNVADSLAAIKKHVFENKTVSMERLMKACWDNFEGEKGLRQILLNRSPKYGNDDDYVDNIAKDIYQIVKGGRLAKRLYHTVGTHVYYGEKVGALPDGRKASIPLADAGVSPVQGMDKNGPTALLRSASKFDPEGDAWAHLLNMKFDKGSLEGNRGLRNLIALVKAYYIMNGNTIQFNIVDAETLKNAQKHPEEFTNLIVRVAGFSAYFGQLDKTTQDEIIRRTTHSLT